MVWYKSTNIRICFLFVYFNSSIKSTCSNLKISQRKSNKQGIKNNKRNNKQNYFDYKEINIKKVIFWKRRSYILFPIEPLLALQANLIFPQSRETPPLSKVDIIDFVFQSSKNSIISIVLEFTVQNFGFQRNNLRKS